GDSAMRDEPKRRHDNCERFARTKEGLSPGSASTLHNIANFPRDCRARLSGIDFCCAEFVSDEGIASGEPGIAGKMGGNSDDLPKNSGGKSEPPRNSLPARPCGASATRFCDERGGCQKGVCRRIENRSRERPGGILVKKAGKERR